MIIYKVTNQLNGKLYIGQTTQTLAIRWGEHSRPHKNATGSLRAIVQAIRDHGKENFTVEQIDSAQSIDELYIKEQTYIKAFNTLVPNGYNLQPGGKNRKAHPQTRAKIANALKGRPIMNRWTGGNRTPRTKEQKAHLSALNKGKPNVSLYKRIQCIETGEIYDSINEAAARHGVNRVTISGLLKTGKCSRKLGLSFKFLDTSPKALVA